MTNNPKILIAAPTAKVKDYCFKDWTKNVKSFTYPNFDIILIDNSIGTYSLKLAEHFLTRHIEPYKNETNRETILRCQNYIREYFLEHDYDYLFSLETDIFPPVNVIEYLLLLNKDVVCLPYFVGQAYYSRIMMFDTEDFGLIRLGKPMSQDKSFLFFDGKVKQVNQPGIGCMLIKRHIIEKFAFRIDLNDPAKSHADVYFNEDLRKAGIPVYMDTSFICQHINKNWRKLEQFKNL
jgi:hypothetical protein